MSDGQMGLAAYYKGSKSMLQPSPLTRVFICLPCLDQLPRGLEDIFGPCCEFSSYVASNYPCGGIPSHPVVNSRSLGLRSGTSSSSHVDH
jgi:hypothetical protein